jgi:hypothetical protein
VVDADTVKGPSYARFQAEDEREQIDGEKPVSRDPDVGGVPRGFLAAGQAGALKRHVLAMPCDEGAHIMVKFLSGRERHEARRILRRLIADYLHLRATDRRAAALMLSWYYGAKGITVAEVARRLNLNRRRVSKIRNQVYIQLNALSMRAENRLYQALQEKGIVG